VGPNGSELVMRGVDLCGASLLHFTRVYVGNQAPRPLSYNIISTDVPRLDNSNSHGPVWHHGRPASHAADSGRRGVQHGGPNFSAGGGVSDVPGCCTCRRAHCMGCQNAAAGGICGARFPSNL
jgi:hypothetical protein